MANPPPKNVHLLPFYRIWTKVMIYAGKILGFWINVCDSMSSFARRLDISSELAFVTSFTSLRPVPNLFILNLFHMALAFTSECITFTKMSRALPVCNNLEDIFEDWLLHSVLVNTFWSIKRLKLTKITIYIFLFISFWLFNRKLDWKWVLHLFSCLFGALLMINGINMFKLWVVILLYRGYRPVSLFKIFIVSLNPTMDTRMRASNVALCAKKKPKTKPPPQPPNPPQKKPASCVFEKYLEFIICVVDSTGIL